MFSLHDSDICRSILESLPTGVCVVDMQKKILLWSDGAERITGHLRHEVVGRSCIAEPLIHCNQPGCEFCSEECPLARAMKTSHAAESNGVLQHKSGYEVPVRLRAVPVRTPNGSIFGAVEVFEDLQSSAIAGHSSSTHSQSSWILLRVRQAVPRRSGICIEHSRHIANRRSRLECY